MQTRRWSRDKRKVKTNKDGEFYQLVFNLTPFYPEGGGQVGDKGYIETQNGQLHYITDTKKENNLIIHFSKTLPTRIEEKIKVYVDKKQRLRTSCNHSATHLLHQALRSILGDHVEQKGSMVHSGMFRFDFSHFSKLSNDEIVQVESFVNARIKEQLPLEEERNIPYKSAIEKGAIALFGEKYGDTVRTIRFGQSIELCGGCHVKNTSEIWYFKILNESAIASGVRRIEAITGDAVISHFEDQSKTLQSLNTLIKKSQDPLKAFNTLIEENSELRKELKSLTKLKIQLIKSDLVKVIKKKKKINFAAKEIDLDQKYIRDLAFELGKGFNNLFLVLASKINGKAFLSCYISKELVKSKGFNASKIVKTLSEYIGGSGGGQSFYATAGGKKTEGIEKAIKFSESLV